MLRWASVFLWHHSQTFWITVVAQDPFDNVRYHVYRPLSGFLHEKVLAHTLRQFSIDQWQRSRRGSIYGVVHVYRMQTSPFIYLCSSAFDRSVVA